MGNDSKEITIAVAIPLIRVKRLNGDKPASVLN